MPPAHPRVVVRDPGAKKRHILEAARRLLVDRDFHDIVLDDVAKKAGVAKGTLFLHFKSKEELFSAAFADSAESLGLEFEALGRASVAGKELLVAAAKAVLNHFDRNRDFIGLGAGRMPNCGARSREKLREKCASNQERMLGLLRQASSDAGASLRDPDFAAAAFIGLCRSAAVSRLLRGLDGSFERDAERVVSLFLEGSGTTL